MGGGVCRDDLLMSIVAKKSRPLLVAAVVTLVLAALVAAWAWVSSTQIESSADASAVQAYFWVAAAVAVVGVVLLAASARRHR